MNDFEIHGLRERAKELRCLYRVHGVVSQRGQPPGQTFLRVLEAIPDGWQRPASVGACIEYLGRLYVGPGYSSAGPRMSQPIHLSGVEVGRIDVSDSAPLDGDVRPFLEEEAELLRNIAHRLSDYLEWKHTELLGERVALTSVHWRWRESYADALAASLDAKRFGVMALYVGGSTETGVAGPGSDIDLLVAFAGTSEQREALRHWLEGWSLCMAEISVRQTGYAFPRGLLNVRWLDAPVRPEHMDGVRALPLGQSKATESGVDQ